MKRGYDLIVPFYDKLAELIYSNALRKAQTQFLPFIPLGSSILIAGGGTGWILEEITRIHSQGLYIDYVDISTKMIERARRRSVGKNEVQFINQSILDWLPQIDYDIIITPFFFDNFSEANSQKIFILLHSALRINGYFFHTDFQISNPYAYWQKILLSVMYTFFRATANIEARRLPDIKTLFRTYNYKLINEETFFNKFIITSVYKKLIPDR